MREDKKEKDGEMSYEEEKEGNASLDEENKIGKLKEKLKECQKEKQEYLAGWQRAQADFINFKRRQEEQMGEWLKMFGEGLMRDILPVLDSLEAGIKNQGPGIKEQELGGLAGVRKQLLAILKKHGLEEMKSVGEKFDPERHEAVEEIKSEGKVGEVAEEMQKGYLLNGKILRVAKVRVNK